MLLFYNKLQDIIYEQFKQILKVSLYGSSLTTILTVCIFLPLKLAYLLTESY